MNTSENENAVKPNEDENAVKPKKGLKKVLSVAVDVLLALFLALCLVSLVFSIASRKDSDGAVNLFGIQIRVVVSDSMAACEETDVSSYEIKSIPVRTAVFIQTVPDNEAEAEEWYSQIKVGDVLTFKYVYGGSQETITHRVTNIEGTVITLTGDNKSGQGTLSQVIDYTDGSANYIIGKVTGTSRVLGLLITVVKSPVGVVCIIIIPCVLIIVMEMVRIFGVVSADKKKKAEIAQAEKDDEIAELKKRLAEMEKNSTTEEKPVAGDTQPAISDTQPISGDTQPAASDTEGEREQND